jgi:hypothetical protein
LGWSALLVAFACSEQGASDEDDGNGTGGDGGSANAGAGSGGALEGGTAGGGGSAGRGGAMGTGGSGDSGGLAGSAGSGGSGGFGGEGGAGGDTGDGGIGGAAGEGGSSVNCERTVLARDYPYIKDIALDGAFVYWTTYGTCPIGDNEASASGKVGRVSLDGTNPIPLASRLPCPKSIAVNGGGVFWSNIPQLAAGGVIMAIPSPGAELRRLDLPTESQYPASVAADARSVYWAEVDALGEDGVYKSNRTLTAEPVLLAEIVNADWRVPHQIVLDDDYVYWTDRDYPPDPGLIQRVRKAGGIPEPLATAKDPRELAISSRGLFWIEEPTFDAPIIKMLDWSDIDAAPRFIANAPDVGMLAAADDTVYWASGDFLRTRIYKIRIGDSEPVPMTDEEIGIGSITVDGDYLYYMAGYSEQEIIRICR